jgi:predicted ABC-type ATPase
MDPKEWARANKKKLAREFVRKTGYVARESPAAVFTAGLPGAGKTEFTKELLADIGDEVLRVDMDEIAAFIHGYSPSKADLFRAGASIIMDKIYDEILRKRLDFVMDGTFSHPKALKDVERALAKGYTVKVYFIHQEPKVAWQFTQDRELVERRAIDKGGFIATYQKLHDNIVKLQNLHKDVSISVITKDASNRIGARHEAVEDVYNVVPKPLESDQLMRDIVE